MKGVKDMTEGRPFGLILQFSLPLMLGNVGQQLYTVVDAIIVGQGVGVEALAALGATDWIYWLFLWSSTAMTQGFSILLSQRFGAKNTEGLRKAFTMSALLSIGIGIAFTVIGLAAARPLLHLLHTPADIFDRALSYLYTLLAGMTIVVFYNMAASILRSLGNGKAPLIAMVIAACVNIALDLLFVMVFHWGIVGAAVATLIAQLFSFLYCLNAIRQIEVLHTSRTDWKPLKSDLCRLLGLGTPLALQFFIIVAGGMVLQSVLNRFGFIFVAGITATNKLYGILESTAISFGYAMTTYMGQNLGAGHYLRLKSGMQAVLKLCAIVSTSIAVSMLLFGKNILVLFVPPEGTYSLQVIDIAYQYLCVMSVPLMVLYILHVYRACLQGFGNTIASVICGILQFGMRVGVALILPRFLGEFGLFFAEPAAWLGAAIVVVIWYYRDMAKLKIKLTSEKACAAECDV